MNVLEMLMAELPCPMGLSDHSAMLAPSIIATSLGARMIEVHVTMSRHMFGPDVSSSHTVESLTQLAAEMRFAHRMRTSPVDKNALAQEKAPLKALFGKSAMVTRALNAGENVPEDALRFRKPGHGLNEAAFDALSHRPLTKNVAAGSWLKEEDFT
jgi:N-acetylneuraminate synthase